VSQSLTRVPRSSPDTVAALEQLLHHPRADEAAGAGHAHQLLLLTAVGLGRHGDPAQQVPMPNKFSVCLCLDLSHSLLPVDRCCLVW